MKPKANARAKNTAQAVKLFIAIPTYGGTPIEFTQSLMRLQAAPPFALEIGFVPGDSLVSRARNTLTAQFLRSDCTHLLFIDSDLIFSADQIRLLVESNQPVVGGFYPKKKEGELEWVCNGWPGGRPVDAQGLQSLRYIGTGFLLVHRRVFQKMLKAFGPQMAYRPDPRPETTEHDFWAVGPYEDKQGYRRYLSEDWYFCQRWLDLGGQVYGHTRVILKHVGHAVYPLQTQYAAIQHMHSNCTPNSAAGANIPKLVNNVIAALLPSPEVAL